MWTVKVSNHSNAVVTELEVTVFGCDAEGNKVEDGCEQANGKLGTAEMFRRVVQDALAGSIDAAAGARGFGGGMMPGMQGGLSGLMGGQSLGAMAAPRIAPQISDALKEALTGQMTTVWPTTLTPAQEAVMAFAAAEGVDTLVVYITFTDEAGYQWFRADNAGPRRLDAEDE